MSREPGGKEKAAGQVGRMNREKDSEENAIPCE
jgi:hypothetical protein